MAEPQPADDRKEGTAAPGSRSTVGVDFKAGSIAGARTGAKPKADVWRTVLHVAWLAILVGFGIELLLLAIAAFFGGGISDPKPFVADLVQKVSWSFLVCVGIAFGTAATKARAPVMGLLGVISAPIAFNTARFLHKGVAEALSTAGAGVAGASPFLIALLKAVEYGFLGWTVGWVGRRPWGKLAAHAGVGLAAGLTFGLGIVLVLGQASATPPAMPALLARGVNEVLFPVGCSVILYVADTLSKRLSG